ncbi:hypothetical protein D3C77_804670 [compost metagenome]
MRFIEEVHSKACWHQVFANLVPLDRSAAVLAVDLQSGVDGRVAGAALPAAPGLLEEL